MQDGLAQPGEPEQGLEQGGDRRLADPAQAQRGHGDAELAGGQIGLQMLEDPGGQPRAGAAGDRQRLEPDGADLDQGELGRDEKGVRGEQQDDGDEGEVHRRLPPEPAAGRVLSHPRPIPRAPLHPARPRW